MVHVDALPESARRYRLLLDLARDVTAELGLEPMLATTFRALRQMLAFTGGSIALVDDDGFLSFAATDPPATAEALATRVRVGDGISGGIAATGEPAYVPDIFDDPAVDPERRRKATSSGMRSYFGVPLITAGRPIGVLQIDSTEVDAFDEEDRLLLLAFTPIVAAAVQNALVHAREAAALDRLRELDARHRDFVATVSHELRTPLTTILGNLDTVLSHHDQLDPDDTLALVHRTRRSATHLASLVEQLLDLSLIQRGELRLELVEVDVGELLDDVIAEYAALDRTVSVSVEDVPTVRTDRTRLAQVVGNLLSNAQKFSPPDSVVTVGACRVGDSVVISVRDNGPGIPEEARERIFERFVQLERASVRRVGGFGIGLHVVAQLCSALGASVSVDSVPGHGATFSVRLPAG